ncbi:MAG: hypothetical protein JKX81_05340, partial [Arenicella sp.]|nr:hypothetical protein [Arenicella sp.]
MSEIEIKVEHIGKARASFENVVPLPEKAVPLPEKAVPLLGKSVSGHAKRVGITTLG